MFQNQIWKTANRHVKLLSWCLGGLGPFTVPIARSGEVWRHERLRRTRWWALRMSRCMVCADAGVFTFFPSWSDSKKDTPMTCRVGGPPCHHRNLRCPGLKSMPRPRPVQIQACQGQHISNRGGLRSDIPTATTGCSPTCWTYLSIFNRACDDQISRFGKSVIDLSATPTGST